jgi:hypothetical protein
LVTASLVALLVGFAVGRSTVAPRVIGADPREFAAQTAELDELTLVADALHHEFCRGVFVPEETSIELNGHTTTIRCEPSSDGFTGRVVLPRGSPRWTLERTARRNVRRAVD